MCKSCATCRSARSLPLCLRAQLRNVQLLSVLLRIAVGARYCQATLETATYSSHILQKGIEVKGPLRKRIWRLAKSKPSPREASHHGPHLQRGVTRATDDHAIAEVDAMHLSRMTFQSHEGA